MRHNAGNKILGRNRLTASFQSIDPVSEKGQIQVLGDIREKVALELSKIITQATKDEEKLAPSWAERFPDPCPR